MTKYTKDELKELAKGVFRSNNTTARIYAREDGTFINEEQYEERQKEGTHKDFNFKFDNPNVKQKAVDSGELEKVRKDLGEAKGLIEKQKKALVAKDAEIKKLKEQLKEQSKK